jgi:hypothetical protein
MYKKYFILLFSLLLLTGCNRSGLRGLVSCSGEVTLDGAPLAGATVTLIPDKEGVAAEGAEQRNALATTDANGHFTMTTLNPNDGVFPGKYWVQVTKYEQSGKFIGTGETGDDGKEVMFEQSVNRLPAIYENYQKSELRVEVPASGIKNVKLDLVAKP